MKNKLIDLNNHLFMQLERLNDEGVKGAELLEEVERSKALSGIAKDIVSNAKTILDARKAAWEWNKVPGDMPTMLEG